MLAALPDATEKLATFAEPFVVPQSDRSPGIRLALQEITNDLYDGFLSKQDRGKLAKNDVLPELKTVPPAPFVMLDTEADGVLPSYVPAENSVHFPVWLAQPDGVLAWVSLAHETSGHAFLEAYGLRKKIRRTIREELGEQKGGERWRGWFDEAASDCLGVLNLGPTMAIGAIASWRALGKLTNGEAHMPRDPLEQANTHPPYALRAYLMAHVTSKLAFKQAGDISKALKAQVNGELQASKVGNGLLEGAEIFANALVEQPQDALQGHSFLDLQNWRDSDQEITELLRRLLLEDSLPRHFGPKHYAAHALAAAISESIEPTRGRDEYRVLRNLISLLKLMHECGRAQNARAELGLPDQTSAKSARRAQRTRHRLKKARS